MIVDDSGPWTAAAHLVDDVSATGTCHGVHDAETLCGLPAGAFQIYRHPFRGTSPRDCRTCADRLRELSGELGDP